MDIFDQEHYDNLRDYNYRDLCNIVLQRLENIPDDPIIPKKIDIWLIGGFAKEATEIYTGRPCPLDRDTYDVDFYCMDAILLGIVDSDFSLAPARTGLSTRIEHNGTEITIELLNMLEHEDLENSIHERITKYPESVKPIVQSGKFNIYALPLDLWVATKTNACRLKDKNDINDLYKLIDQDEIRNIEKTLGKLQLLEKYECLLNL